MKLKTPLATNDNEKKKNTIYMPLNCHRSQL